MKIAASRVPKQFNQGPAHFRHAHRLIVTDPTSHCFLGCLPYFLLYR